MHLQRLLPIVFLATTASAQLHVVAEAPVRNVINAAQNAAIVVEFDRPVDLTSLAHVRVYGNFSGPIIGSTSLEAGGTVMRYIPREAFLPGETVKVNIPRQVAGQDGVHMRMEGHSYRFRAMAAPASMIFSTEEIISVRGPGNSPTRLYGVTAVDLNADRRIDLAAVNEISSDVRILMNNPSNGQTYQPFLTPTNATDDSPSPSATADFDEDGLIDLVTANTGSDTITVLLGNGDGTFQSGTDYWVGNSPYGLQAIDLDGDGDQDIAISAQAAGHLGVLMNDGLANFSAASTFDGGGSREFGLCAVDMNNDGIPDLVCGLWAPPSVAVHIGNGDGTFFLTDVEAAGSDVWQISCGDVNGDGNLDITSASATGNSSVLIGDGLGNLSRSQVFDAGNFTTGSELGDLDGDGDLDWVLSDFGTGYWTLLENNGSGSFSVKQTFQAASNPSGSSMYDIDGDGDLDLALIDEISDLIRLEFNKSPATYFCFGDGTTNTCPCGNDSPLGSNRGCSNSTGTGALSLAIGSPSVAAADLKFNLHNIPRNKVGLLVASTNPSNFPLGDGVFCLGGPQIRFPVQFSNSLGSLSQGDLGSVLPLSSGDRYWFQFAYRDVAGPCGGGFNSSNGMGVNFAP